MVSPMKLKLGKYFEEMPPIITCTAEESPCFNVRGVKLLIDSITNDFECFDNNVDFVKDANKSFNKSFESLWDL